MANWNQAPRVGTVAVALLLVLLGVLGTFVPLLPEVVGVGAFVAATVVMLLGILLPGL